MKNACHALEMNEQKKAEKSQMENIFLHCFIILLKVSALAFPSSFASLSLLFPKAHRLSAAESEEKQRKASSEHKQLLEC
jgi:hypothetical protein